MSSISKERRETILNSLPDICALCGLGEREGDPWTLDHISPRAIGGGNARVNLQKAHKFCNHLHGAKLHLAILQAERQRLGYLDVFVDENLMSQIEKSILSESYPPIGE